MRKFILFVIVILSGYSFNSFSLVPKENLNTIVSYFDPFSQKPEEFKFEIPVNKKSINAFFKKYPNLKQYESEVGILYENRKYNEIWYDANGKLIELSQVLYSKINSLQEEGVESRMDYQEIMDGIFDSNSKPLSQTEAEIMLSTMYVFYVQKVFLGVDAEKLQQTGWFLPKKNIAYELLLDSLLQNPELLNFDEKHQLSQYYKLREALKNTAR